MFSALKDPLCLFCWGMTLVSGSQREEPCGGNMRFDLLEASVRTSLQLKPLEDVVTLEARRWRNHYIMAC